MINRTYKQAGFVMLEAILALVAVAAIAAAGYFAYQAHKNKSSNVSSTKTTPAPAAKTTPAKPANEYDIKELGIKITLPSGLSANDLEYSADTSSQTNTDPEGKSITTYSSANFSTKSLTAAGGTDTLDGSPACGVSKSALGILEMESVNPEGLDFGSGPGLIKKIGDKYLAYSSPQAMCSSDDQANQLQLQQLKLINQALQTAQPLN